MEVSGQESLEARAYLQLCLEDELVEEFELRSPVVSLGGSEDCDIVLDGSAAADYQALLSPRAGKLVVEDAKTRGELASSVVLSPGESLDIAGHYSVRLVAQPSGRPRPVESLRDASGAAGARLRVSGSVLANLGQAAVRPAYLTLNADKRETWIVRLDRPLVTIGGARTADIRVGGWFTPASIAAVEQRVDGSYLVVEPGREMEVDGRRIVDEARLSEGTRLRVRELSGVFHEQVGIPH